MAPSVRISCIQMIVELFSERVDRIVSQFGNNKA